MKVGLPMGVQGVLDVGSFTVFSAMIGRMGNVELKQTQYNNFASSSFMPLIGISLAATTLVGQYIGSTNMKMHESGYTAIKVGVAYTVLWPTLLLCAKCASIPSYG